MIDPASAADVLTPIVSSLIAGLVAGYIARTGIKAASDQMREEQRHQADLAAQERFQRRREVVYVDMFSVMGPHVEAVLVRESLPSAIGSDNDRRAIGSRIQALASDSVMDAWQLLGIALAAYATARLAWNQVGEAVAERDVDPYWTEHVEPAAIDVLAAWGVLRERIRTELNAEPGGATSGANRGQDADQDDPAS